MTLPENPRATGLNRPVFPILCRPAGAADTLEVMRMLARIWGGEDYVPHVWEGWLRDETGVLAVAEQGSRIAGMGHLSDLGLGETWLEGLRVDPQAQGRGVGSHLHGYLVEQWLGMGRAVVRLITSVERVQVHAMCSRTSFTSAAEVQFHRAPAMAGRQAFQPVPSDTPEAWEALTRTGSQRQSQGLFDLGWEFADLRLERMAVSPGLGMWTWRDGLGWLVARSPVPQGDPELTLGAACAANLAGLLRDSLSLAHDLGAEQVHWLAPVAPEILSALEAAGFASEGRPERFRVFERRKVASGF